MKAYIFIEDLNGKNYSYESWDYQRKGLWFAGMIGVADGNCNKVLF